MSPFKIGQSQAEVARWRDAAARFSTRTIANSNHYSSGAIGTSLSNGLVADVFEFLWRGAVAVASSADALFAAAPGPTFVTGVVDTRNRDRVTTLGDIIGRAADVVLLMIGGVVGWPIGVDAFLAWLACAVGFGSKRPDESRRAETSSSPPNKLPNKAANPSGADDIAGTAAWLGVAEFPAVHCRLSRARIPVGAGSFFRSRSSAG
jgi:hypothetical protein